MSEIVLDGVTKVFDDGYEAVKDMNLDIGDGEFMILVGPSGCGKSTALRMIAGLEDISSGELKIGDEVVNDRSPKDRDIAMVFQNYALYPHMSVYDNMAFSLKLRHMPKSEIDTRVHKAAQMLGISEYLARKPKELSGGQRQRVALGRALVRDPQVFLLDEPLSNLDAKLRVQTRAEISRLHQAAHTTFVYVTHDQVEAMTMGDRIAVLNAGVIQQLGTPQELYDAPANLFVAGFIGSPSMNFFSARLTRQPDGGAQVTLGDGVGAPTFPLSGQVAEQVTGQATATDGGRPVIVGIRPEEFRLDAAADAQATLSGTVDVVEHLGNEQLVYVRLPGATLPEQVKQAKEQAHDEGSAVEATTSTARLPTDAMVKPGMSLTLAVDTTRMHLFDPTTTNRFV